MAQRFAKLGALIAAAMLGGALPAAAHPHIWVTMNADVVFNDGGEVDGINLSWTFDDAYAQMALDGLDANGDGVYSQDELAPLTKDNLDALRDYDFFTVVRFNGEKQKIGEATDYGQIYSNDKLELHFHVPLEKPVDPRKGEFALKVYDPDFFVDLEYAKDDPVTVIGTMPSSCKLEMKPVPTDAELDETRLMLSTKGKDWKPENNEDFGAMFAQPVVVACM